MTLINLLLHDPVVYIALGLYLGGCAVLFFWART